MSSRPQTIETARIGDALADGRGVARVSGKAVFVHGALSGETVNFVRRKKRRRYDEADLVEVLEASPARVAPRCAVFGVCGGCSLQHVATEQQLELKQNVLLDSLARIGKVRPDQLLTPLTGVAWGYRRRARLAVKYVTRKERVLVGFRERHKPYVVDMSDCATLHPQVAALLTPLAELIAGLSIRQRLPQIEVAVADNATALVFRVLDPPGESDLDRLTAFQREHGIRLMLQPEGPNSIQPLPGSTAAEPLYYRIPGFDFRLEFGPTDFVQVNAEVNTAMVHRALELLAPAADARVLDLYCGLGNFSLPLATCAAAVTGLDWDAAMIGRARRNAVNAGLDNLRFASVDLTDPPPAEFANHDLVLLDPPRTGASEVLALLADTSPRKILYVSCNPGTLARDADELVHRLGYRLESAGVADMFAQTSHIESMALFSR